MPFSFSSFGHAAASVLHDIVKVGTATEKVADKVAGNEQLVEMVTSMVDPAAVPVERAAFGVLGVVLQAMHGADAAGQANGFNVAIDAQLAQDLKQIYELAMGRLKIVGLAQTK